MHLSNTSGKQDSVKSRELLVTSVRCVFRRGALRKVTCQGTSVRAKWGALRRNPKPFREREGGKVNRGGGGWGEGEVGDR